ncbi:cytochrome P450 [Calothrix sp. 336/3]|uniref:cytochrome P450 n=1 Tax=Calothrix sp. 336/3 TaxID=1337936 RepID=UPI0004E45444|nr:cytochrome P450 [Calothrix sp. 336/3]AKG24327.1 cytochrome P450 [Calothrix sp. 336/3]
MKLPQGPQTPAIVQMLQWIARPMPYMEECAKKYGDIFTLHLSFPILFVSHPQAIQQILTSDNKDFTAPSRANQLFAPLLGKNSVITLEGEPHFRQRQLITPPFHGERMKTYTEVITKITESVMGQWRIGQSVDARAAMQAITMRVIMQAVFGLHEGERAEELERLLAIMLEEGGSSPLRAALLYIPILQQDLGTWYPWGRFLRRRQRVNELIYAEIRERRAQADTSRTDILSLLMAAQDENGVGMTDEELRDELMTLLTAGHETTATALAWALYWIHKFPEVKEKLLAELDTVPDKSDLNTLLKLPYLNAVCNETLRIYPVAMLTFPRSVKNTLTLSGHELQPGTLVMGAIYLTHQREDLYPNPKQFRPERFLERQYSPYEFVPFGGGARRCVGTAFAQLEMKLVLATILSSLNLDLATKGDILPRRRGLVTGPDRVIELVVQGQRQVKTSLLEKVSS